jgi:hypothetical protein
MITIRYLKIKYINVQYIDITKIDNDNKINIRITQNDQQVASETNVPPSQMPVKFIKGLLCTSVHPSETN